MNKKKLLWAVFIVILCVAGSIQYYRALYPPEPQIEGWGITVSSKEEAISRANNALSQLLHGTTNLSPICVLETEDFYDVVYPMVVPPERVGDDRKTECLIPKRKEGMPEIIYRGISEAELQTRRKK